MIPAAVYPGEHARIAASISDSTRLELIQLTLSAAVPIEIEHLRAQGGPNDYQMDAAHHYIQQHRLGEAILFAAKNETSEQMRVLCEIVAILAWCPGGITIFGLHFEAKAEVSR